MSKILVTGAGGYIGSIAAYLLLKNGYEVVVLDNFTTGFHQPIDTLKEIFKNASLVVYEADTKDNISSIFEKESIDVVLHYAASCVVDESVKNPYKYFHNNVFGTLNLIETMTKFNVNKLVFSSTCAVYGEAEFIPIDEKHPTRPDSPYGESKLMAEKIIQWHSKLKGLESVILRYFNVSGATEDGKLGYSKNPSTHLTENAVRGALGISPFYLTYQEVDTPDTSPIRDYVNVLDLNEAHLKAVEYLANGGKSELINLGTGTGNSVLEIVETVQNQTGKKFEVKKGEARAGESAKLVASINKAKRVLGWEPKRTIADSIKSLILWYNKHANGWQK